MKPMTIQKILKRLLQLHPKSEPSTLNRIKRLLKDLNSPENKISNLIQVVGTNGKHSFCVFFREIVEKAGYTCNLNISPSLRFFNERYYFSGKYISDENLYNLLIEVEKINGDQSISFHEIITAAVIFGNTPSASTLTFEYDGSSWTAGGALPIPVMRTTGSGTQTAALQAGNGPSAQAGTHLYDGTSWATNASLATARYNNGASSNSNTAAFVFGGYTPPTVNTTENFNEASSAINIKTITTS